MFAAFSDDLGDLRKRSSFINIEALDLFKFALCEARLSCHLSYPRLQHQVSQGSAYVYQLVCACGPGSAWPFPDWLSWLGALLVTHHERFHVGIWLLSSLVC